MNQPIRAEIGKYIIDYLNDNDMTVSQFANEKLGASKSSVYAWMNGERPSNIFYKMLLELLQPYFDK